nr:MAG TPA: hypothetical protein [Caudoviricetes sp.]
MMGIFLGVLVVLVLAFAAFIHIVSTDNGQGYQPNKLLNGPPPNKGNCIQKLPDDKKRHKAALMIQTGDFRKPERIIGIVYGEDAALWHAYIFKSCCGAKYFEDNGELAGVVILPEEDK